MKIGGCVSNFNGFNGSGSFNIGSGLNGSGLNGNDGVWFELYNVFMFVILLFIFFVVYNWKIFIIKLLIDINIVIVFEFFI